MSALEAKTAPSAIDHVLLSLQAPSRSCGTTKGIGCYGTWKGFRTFHYKHSFRTLRIRKTNFAPTELCIFRRRISLSLRFFVGTRRSGGQKETFSSARLLFGELAAKRSRKCRRSAVMVRVVVDDALCAVYLLQEKYQCEFVRQRHWRE